MPNVFFVRPARLVLPLVVAALLLPLSAGAGASPKATTKTTTTPKKDPAPASGQATVGHRFPGLEKARKMYDDPSRAAWQKPKELVAALGIAAGDRVADLGAGTGFFLDALGAAVGPAGTVYAVEVEPQLVAELRRRADERKLAQIVPVLGSFDNPRLPRGCVDLVLVVDTYHHVDERGTYFRELARVLSTRGRLVIVDFHKRPLPVGPKPSHKLDEEVVVAELEAAGWRLLRRHDGLLPYQYVLELEPSAQRQDP